MTGPISDPATMVGNPYDWVIERLPSEGVVDLAGAKGALTVRLPLAVAATPLDSSATELADARGRGSRWLADAVSCCGPAQWR